MQKRRRGFTLVELLVVISIIGLLAGLAFPAFNAAMNAAKKAQTSAVISQVKTALTAYNTEYGTWPSDAAGAPTLSPTNAYTMLIGDPTSSIPVGSSYSNPRGIVFMEFQNKDLDIPKAPTKFVDPWWKSTKQDYNIVVDAGYNNTLSVPDVTAAAAGANVNLSAGAAIWSVGLPVKGVANTVPSNFIRSW